jgi:ABC transport system ATP-binding/permease protein
MNIVSVEQLGKAFPERPVLSGVTFGIDENDRIGVIGANGSGKSTLLGLLAGTIAPDEGRVVWGNHVRIATLDQDPVFEPASTLAEVAGSGHQTVALLDRLGLTDLDAKMGELSGGQRRRVALALTLAQEAELTILDEPTNHLDVEVIDWLEDEMAARPGALVIVTHDRYLLDRVATRVLEVNDTALVSHRGNYQDFLESRAEREALAATAERKRQNLARTELEWLRRSPKARTGKSKARIDAANRLLAAEPVKERVSLEFDFPSRRLGGKVVELRNAGMGFDGRSVLSDITWSLHSDARIGLVGPNGAGKTTLLRLMAGRLEPVSGSVQIGETVVPGWYGQDPEPLPTGKRILEVIRDIAEETRLGSGIRVSASELLTRFGFPSSQHSTTVEELSGGERRRLELLRVLATVPNVLLLDEPTNDLDLDTLGALEGFLDDWPGAVVASSHDRYFLERVCRDIISIESDGGIRHHPGGWAAYRREMPATARARSRGRSGSPSAEPGAPEPGAAVPAPPGQRTGPNGRLSYTERREFDRLERSIPEMESSVARLTVELGAAGSDWQAATAVGERLHAAQAELAAAEERWLELSERA